MADSSSFGAWLRHRREALDLTQAELAQRAGCALDTLRDIEADQASPAGALAARFASALAVGVEEVPTIAGPTRTETPTRPTGLVTFLFTDIEGSTRRWERYPDAMRSAFQRQELLVRQAIAAHHGYTYKMIGDAFQAAFQTAPAALAASIAAQRALSAEPWGEIGQLRVRMALHTGQVEERGDDYVGPQLNRVARLLAAGHGGQILLTSATAELLCSQLPPGVTLRDLGRRRLKDLRLPEHIFQAVIADLPVDFPPLKTLDHRRHNLAAQPTPFIGREREVASLCNQLRHPDVRLVTLTGPGGIGKTRLSLQTARALLDEFSDGVWFVGLAPISDTDLVAPTIAQCFGLKDTGNRLALDALKAYLRDKQLLLLLDNFEQIVDASPQVAELLAAAPSLKVLSTSRAALNLYGEHEFVVPPLLLPPHIRAHEPAGRAEHKHIPIASSGTLGELSRYEALRLFAARSQAASPEFEITGENVQLVAEICRRLDGLPLAIELAAARIKLFAPQALLAGLIGTDQASSLKLLTHGERDRPARHQTLRSAIAWSYDLLSASEQALFRQLATFVGGCTPDAAVAVLIAEEPAPINGAPNPTLLSGQAVLDGLAALAGQSLLRQELGEDGAPRFTMLETIREYALEQLELSVQADTLRHRHTCFFLATAEAAEPRLFGEEQQQWLQRLARDLENFRAALTWSLEQRHAPELGARLAGALWWFWWHIAAREGRQWLATALDQSDQIAPPVRGQLLYRAAYLAWRHGNYAQATSLSTAGLALHQQLGDHAGQAWSRGILGLVALRQSDYAKAIAHLDASLSLFRELGQTWGCAWALNGMGQVNMEQGQLEAATTQWQASLTAFKATGDIEGRAHLIRNLGHIAWRRAEPEQALAHWQESLALFEACGNNADRAWNLNDIGDVTRWMGDIAHAEQCYEQSLAVFEEMGDQQGSAAVLHNLGYIAQAQSDYARARACFAKSLTFFHTIGHTTSIADCIIGLIGTAVLAGRAKRAARLRGAVAGLIDRISAQASFLTPANRAELERIDKAIAVQLSQETYNAAWQAGHALDIEQMVTEALGDAD